MATIFGPPYVTTTDNSTYAYGATTTWPYVEVDYRVPPRPLPRDSDLYRLLVDTAGDYNANTPKEKEEAKPAMRGLYEITVVDPETDSFVLIEGKVTWKTIAKDETSAKLKAVSKAVLPKDVDEYDIIVRRLGDVRPKKPEPQLVKVVKE